MKRILLIEDDLITREMYAPLLKQHGFDVTIATDIRTAADKLQQNPPDAALMDLIMPDTHGLDLLRKVRSNKALKHLPVLVYTSMFIPSVVEEAMEAGATRMFDKALVSPEKLIDTLKECLNPRQEAA